MWQMDEKMFLRLHDQDIRAAMRAARGDGPGKPVAPAERKQIGDLFGLFAAAASSMLTALRFRSHPAR